MRVYMKMYFSVLDDWEDLSDEEVGKLLRASLSYAKNGTEPYFEDRSLRVAFRAQKRHIDEDIAAYDDTSAKRSVAGAMGGRPRKDEKQKKQMLSEKANAFQESNCIQEKEKEKEKENLSKERVGRFTPPTAEEVQEYCKERGNRVDAERFVNFYQQKNWMVGKNKMVDWRAAVRNWEARDKAEHPKSQYENKDLEKLEVDLLGGDFSW